MAQQLSDKIQSFIDLLESSITHTAGNDDSKEESKLQSSPNNLSRKLTIKRIKQSGSGFAVTADALKRRTKNRRVFLRADLNVPLNKETLEITDDTRITSTIPTIIEILKLNPDRVVITSHLGRPAGNG